MRVVRSRRGRSRVQVTAAVYADVERELERTATRMMPPDDLRRAAIVAEEAGEVIKAALDLTRDPDQQSPIQHQLLRSELYKELTHTAAASIRVMRMMQTESEE